MNEKSDLHLHTIVSDGEVTPQELLATAQELKLGKISITDHDAVGAYRHFGFDIFGEAEEMDLLLIPGIELDSDYKKVEIHILGYGINTADSSLTSYLHQVQTPRKQRILEQIHLINRHFNREVLMESEIFVPYRDTFMKPHLIRPLVKSNLFADYRAASTWVAQNIKVSTSVPKLHPAEMISLVKKAGGHAYLAHPGFYIREWGIDIDTLLRELIPLGLEGIEVDYRYYNTSPQFSTLESEAEMIRLLREKAQQYGLQTSRGSDAHDLESMRMFNKR